MTIGIAVVVPDGIALAADSLNTWMTAISKCQTKQYGEAELAKPIVVASGSASGARKLFPFSYGKNGQGKGAVLISGEATLGQHSVKSIFKNLELSDAIRKTTDCDKVFSLIVAGLKDSLRQAFAEGRPLKEGPSRSMAFAFCSFRDGVIIKPFLRAATVFSGVRRAAGQPDNDTGEFIFFDIQDKPTGWAAVGETQYVSHLLSHKNPDLPPISDQWSLMTLAEAVDYVRFLVGFTCDYQRFAIVPKTCGGKVVTAILTPDEFRFVDDLGPSSPC